MRAGKHLALALLALCTSACDLLTRIGPTICDRSEDANPPATYTEGVVEDGVYKTSEPDGELLYFAGGQRYKLEHKLGERPSYWQAYLSFNQYGIEEGGLAQAAGNQVEVVDVNDTYIYVVNASCVAYWLLFVAGTGADPSKDAGAN